MRRRLPGIIGAIFSLVVFALSLAPVWAEDVDSRIQSLQERIAALKRQQIELRKDAEAAAAALPSFSYRPGGGMRIDAADQSWGIRFRHRFNVDMTWLEGSDARRNGDFELFMRRNRPYFTYFWDRGFYEYEFRLDVDAGDATGIQRAAFAVNFQQIHPWLPRLQFGADTDGSINEFDRPEGDRGAGLEYPLVRRDNGFNTGSHTGVGFLWQNRPMVILPGTWDFNYYWVINGMDRGDGLTDQSSKHDHVLHFSTNPFSQSKNPWLNGFGASMGAWFGNVDERNATNSSRRLRLRTQLGPNRVTLFDSGADADRGLHTYLTPGIMYRVGPYQIMITGGFDRWNTTADRTVANKGGRPGEVGRWEASYFKIINELFVWSPKGLFTGSVNTPNTVAMGWSFERSSADCGRANCDESVTAGGAQFRRNRVLVRELDFVYHFRPALNLLLGWRWYDASNVPTTAQPTLGCSNNLLTRAGKGCDWHDVALRFRFFF